MNQKWLTKKRLSRGWGGSRCQYRYNMRVVDGENTLPLPRSWLTFALKKKILQHICWVKLDRWWITYPPHCTPMFFKLASLKQIIDIVEQRINTKFYPSSHLPSTRRKLDRIYKLNKPILKGHTTCLMSNLVGAPAAASLSPPNGLRVMILRSLVHHW